MKELLRFRVNIISKNNARNTKEERLYLHDGLPSQNGRMTEDARMIVHFVLLRYRSKLKVTYPIEMRVFYSRLIFFVSYYFDRKLSSV